MFYIVEFLKVLKENILVGGLFILSTISIITVAHNRNNVENFLSLTGKSHNSPYFNALVKSQSDLDSVIRKMKTLPGVKSVSVREAKSFKKEVAALKSRFGSSVLSGISGLNYQNLKIELESGVFKKNQKLIREYLSRLVGRNKVTMGTVRKPRTLKLKKSDPLFSLLKLGDKYLLIILTFFWLFSGFLIAKPLKASSYIIEKFQRKSQTDIKILGTGLSVLSAVTIAVNLYFNSDITLLTLVPSLLMTSVCVLFLLAYQKNRAF